ncbi:MAG: histidine kinase [Bacteroidetes bacterium]|nr:histidine kinase [Bacteroidota bacterium]
MSRRVKIIWWNVVGCVVFLSLPILFAPGTFSYSNLISNHKTQQEFFSYFLLVLYYYVNLYVFIPRFFNKKKYSQYALIGILCLAGIVLIPAVTIEHGPHRPPPHMERIGGDGFNHQRPMHDMDDEKNFEGHEDFDGPMRPHHHHGIIPSLFEMSHEIFLFLSITGFSLLFVFNDQLKKIREEKLNSELSLLKAQINPHFLFNTLNSIYSLSIQKSDLAPIAVVKLSAIMRYVTGDSQKKRVSLEKEINYVLDYIDLQKMRFGDTLNLTYKVTGDWLGKQIAPLLLVPFIENAFKHGVNPEKESGVHINIDIGKNDVVLNVSNAIVNTIKDREYEGGLGLENTRNRLKLLYPGKHELKIEESAGEFSVYLKIDLS